MDDEALATALNRADRAIERIERALAARDHQSGGQDEALRSKVREAVAELDLLIRESQAHG